MDAVKIVDSSFRHGDSACHERAPSGFKWKWLDAEDGFDFPDETVFFTDKRLDEAKFYTAGRKVAWVLEPFEVQPERYAWIAENHDLFDVVLTFDRDLIARFPEKFRFFVFGGCWIADENILAYPKTKRCSIIASAKAVTTGQKLRHEVIEAFGDQIDVYGRGYRPIEDKLEALRDYAFTIVIENSRQDDYFSEKLIDSLATGTVPLYWGTSRIADYFPNGILPFQTIEDLRNLVDSACPEPENVTENLERLQNFKLPEDWIWAHYPELFQPTKSRMSKRPSASISDLLNGGRRHRNRISILQEQLTKATEQRDKARAERERYRAERDEVRDERNVARAERDQARSSEKPSEPEPQFIFDDRAKLMAQARESPHVFKFAKEHVISDQVGDTIDTAKGHYFYQDLYVARRIFNLQPKKHVDIASRIDGFVAHVASFRDIEVFDFSDVPAKDEAITFRQADLMQLDEQFAGYADSVSSLHAIEHFGLGRYGDPVDYEGYIKGIENMFKIVKPGGRFYLSTPVGPQRIHFNAHRVFAVRHLMDIGANWGDLDRYSYVADDGHLRENVELEDNLIDDDYGCNYGCGIFEWVKR